MALRAIGSVVEPYGKVAAIGNGGTFGERYYWLVNSDGCVSMMPATIIEEGTEAKDG